MKTSSYEQAQRICHQSAFMERNPKGCTSDQKKVIANGKNEEHWKWYMVYMGVNIPENHIKQ